MDNKFIIEVSWKSLWRILFFTAVAVGLYFSIKILVTVFLAIIISSALNPFVGFLERFKVPRVIGALFVFSAILLVLAAIVYAILPIVIDEANTLLEQFFPVIGKVFNLDTHSSSNMSDLLIKKLYSLIPFAQNGQLFNFSQAVLGNVALALSVLAISFYLLVDHRGVERFLRAILPDMEEGGIIDLFLKARRKMGYWFQAQLLLSLIVALVVFAGLYILGVEHALILGVLAGAFEIVPFAGPVFTGTLAVLVALTQSVELGFYTLILFVIIQQMENNILVPLFMKKAVGLHPVAVLVSLLIGANLFGFIGLLLAVPATVIIQEFIDDWEVKKSKRQRLV